MNLKVIAILAIAFALFALSRALLRYKDKKISLREFSFWSVIWIGIMVLSVFPEALSTISKYFGIERPIDLVVYGSIVLLFYLIFRLYVRIEQTDQSITKLVRMIAIERGKKK